MSSSGRNPSTQNVRLSEMPVIHLTKTQSQRSNDQQASKTAPESQRRDFDTRVTGDPGLRELDIDSVCSKYRKLVPTQDDEQGVICKLAGSGDSCYVELCGWSHQIPTKLFNIRSNTRLPLMSDGYGKIVSAAADLIAKKITLKEVEQLIRNPNQIVNCPIFVHVVAKRKVDVFTSRDQLLILPQVIIADDSGYCVLLSFNEGLDTLYNQVDVGDKLLISRCLPKTPRRVYHRGLFSDDLFINMEIKLQFYSVRNHFLWKFSPLCLSDFKMPAQLFDSSCQLKCPSELEEDFKTAHVQLPYITLPAAQQYYDLIGVISYVGRIERFQSAECMDVECLVNELPVFQKVVRYMQYRWIYLVDQTSAVIPVKIFISNINIELQSALVPGAIIIITHCQTSSCEYSEKHTTTSAFSQLYLESYIEKYYMLHPASFRNKAGAIMNRENYISILTRKDVTFMTGGTHFNMIKDRRKFLKFILDHRTKCLRDIPSQKPLQRRESRRLCFGGIILRTRLCRDEDFPQVIYVNRELYSQELFKKEKGDYKVTETFTTYSAHGNSSWYSFRYVLPSVDNDILKQDKCRAIMRKVVAVNKPYCESLLTPAGVPTAERRGHFVEEYTVSFPVSAGLRKADGPPFLILDIVNTELQMWYTCIWKTGSISLEEKISKLNAAREESILCSAEVFCTEVDAPLEVNLIDFILDHID